MDALEEYIKDNGLSKENILKYVDEYSIYSKYIGAELELRTKYSSPLREGDHDPSFSLFESKFESKRLLFKDNSTGTSGGVFKFVRLLMSNGELIPMRDVLLQIDSDFGIGLGGDDVGEFKPHLLKPPPLQKSATNIEITNHDTPTQEFLDYWSMLDIGQATRDKYFCTNPQIVHYIADYHKSVVPRELTIAYEILGKYKIYCPTAERKYKFRNNYDDNFVEGAMQLEFNKPFCIITKATKECMWFREHFGWETVAGKSENTMINPHTMEVLRSNYQTVYIWLDADEAGIAAQLKYTQMYPWLVPIVMHHSIVQKDVTDMYVAAKPLGRTQDVLNYVNSLIR